jgi:hypothetical protein
MVAVLRIEPVKRTATPGSRLAAQALRAASGHEDQQNRTELDGG